MIYQTRSLKELIDRRENWNINDFINFKSQSNIKMYYAIRKKNKLKIIQHIQTL